MVLTDQDRKDRIRSAIAVGALHALLGYAFLTGLGFEPIRTVGEELKLFDVREPPPPPPAKPPRPERAPAKKKPKPKNAEGAASPANLKDSPTEIMVPPRKIKLPMPPPVVAAPVAGQGNRDAAGATNIRGAGTGAGGVGSGLGSGQYGSGTGGGGGDGGIATHVVKIAGRIRDSDYPRAAFRARIGGTVYLSFVVAPNGRVSACRINRSSGSRDLDETTCRLIIERFRYRPARDESGRPVPETVRGVHEWGIYDEPPPIDIEPEFEEDDR